MLRDGVTGDWMGSLVGHKGAVWCCRMDIATQTMIATASGDYSCRVYDAITGTCIYTFTEAKHILKTCDFNPVSTTLLATAGHEGIVRIYNLVEQERRFFQSGTKEEEDESKKNVIPMEIRVQPLSQLQEDAASTTNKITIGKLNWYNDTILFIGCSDGTVRFYNVEQHATTATAIPNDDKDYPPIHIISTNTKTSSTNCEIRDMEIKQIKV